MHLRAQIRAAAAAAVQDGVTGLASSVQTARVYSLDALPTAVVLTSNEGPAESPSGNPVQLRELELTVELYAAANSVVDTVLDNLAEQVEAALAADPTLGGLVKRLAYIDASTELTEDLEAPAGRLTQSWAVLYRVDTRAPSAPVD